MIVESTNIITFLLKIILGLATPCGVASPYLPHSGGFENPFGLLESMNFEILLFGDFEGFQSFFRFHVVPPRSPRGVPLGTPLERVCVGFGEFVSPDRPLRRGS